MSKPQKETEQENRLKELAKHLNERELKALRDHYGKKEPQLAQSKAEDFYRLFLAGISCEEISRLNPLISFGQIVAARLQFSWDQRKAARQQELMDSASTQVVNVQLEAASFLTNMLTAAMKLHDEKIKRYLQDGDVQHLKGTPLEDHVGFRKIAEIIGTLQQVTGQDKKKVVEHRGGLTVNHNAPVKRIGSEEASEVLDALVSEIKE